VDIGTLVGSFGLFFTLFLLFLRFVPMVAMAEVKGVMPQADPHYYDAGNGHAAGDGEPYIRPATVTAVEQPGEEGAEDA
jgi:molybdopterin-containing oxidoreductase family membrane subunit